MLFTYYLRSFLRLFEIGICSACSEFLKSCHSLFMSFFRSACRAFTLDELLEEICSGSVCIDDVSAIGGGVQCIDRIQDVHEYERKITESGNSEYS